MLILKIVAGIVCLLLLYSVMVKLNSYTYKKYSYEFFTELSVGMYVVIYCGFYFGWEWYINALTENSDTLNGILLIVIALCLLIYMIIKNIKNTSVLFGSLFTLIQMVLMIPISAVALIFLIGLIAFYAQAKPVYNID